MIHQHRSSRDSVATAGEVNLPQLPRSGIENGLHVAPAVEHADNSDRLGGWIIDDQIRKHRPELDG